MSLKIENQNVVLNSVVAVKRNVKDFKFPDQLTYEDSTKIVEKIYNCLKDDFEIKIFDYFDLSEKDREDLYADFIINDKYDDSIKRSIIYFDYDDDEIILTINFEDHLSINISGVDDVENAYEKIIKIEEIIDKKIDFAFDPLFGYLTKNASDSGDGIFIFFKFFLYGICSKQEHYISLKASLAYDNVKFNRLLAYNKPISDYVYTFRPFGNYFEDTKKRIEKIDELVHVIITNEYNFRFNFKKLYNKNKEELQEELSILEGIIKSKKTKTLPKILNYLYELRKYNLLRLDTFIGLKELDELIFEMEKSKYETIDDVNRYRFLSNYLEDVDGK
ncbi:MAG: hypothetical protein Q4B52_02640 [Tissierellia bacterium]|nr:hypothetical protein [Tissierellia bacterium]